ncbi:MAG: hypothetical protein MUO72_07175 [Bacteroidales bacterium]|nr:hypothetical protein [Bacteroidales bacterium]
MRTISIFFIIAGFIVACSQKAGTGKTVNSPEENVRSQVISIATDYASAQLNNAKKSIDKDGIISMSGNGFSYLIDPSKIIISELDEDSEKDAIVPLNLFRGVTPVKTDHLILINKEGKLVIAKTIYNVIKILKIEDRIIVAEVTKVSMDSPTYGCSECIEIAKYQFREGELVKIE